MDRGQRGAEGGARAGRVDAAHMRIWSEAYDEAVHDEVLRCRMQHQSAAELELQQVQAELQGLREERSAELQTRWEEQQAAMERERELLDRLRAEQRAQREAVAELGQEQRRRREALHCVEEGQERAHVILLTLRDQERKAGEEQRGRHGALGELQAAEEREQRWLQELQAEQRQAEDVEDKYHDALTQLESERRRHAALRGQSVGEKEEAQRVQKNLVRRAEEAEQKLCVQFAGERQELEDTCGLLEEHSGALAGKLRESQDAAEEAQSEVGRLKAALQVSVAKELQAQLAKHACEEDRKAQVAALTEQQEAREEDHKAQMAAFMEEREAWEEECKAEAAADREECEARVAALQTELEMKDDIIADIGEARSKMEVDVIKLQGWLTEQVMELSDNIAKEKVSAAGEVLGNLEHVLHVTQAAVGRARAAMEDVPSKVPSSAMPSRWCLTVGQLVSFFTEIEPDLVGYCARHCLWEARPGTSCHVCDVEPCPDDHRGAEHVPRSQMAKRQARLLQRLPANMHLVNQRYVQPIIGDTSFALLKNPGGRMIDTFVTHSWNGLFDELVATLQMALKPADSVWICSFAMAQNTHVEAILEGDPASSPFAVALRAAKKHVVILDSKLDVLDRAWCMYEMALAFNGDAPVMPWMYAAIDHAALMQAIGEMDLTKATASRGMDCKRIQQIATKHLGGCEGLSAKVRGCLAERVRFHGGLAQAHGQELAALRQQLSEARSRGDGASAGELEAQLARWSRDVGAAAERQLAEEDRRAAAGEAASGPAGRGPSEEPGGEGGGGRVGLLRALRAADPELARLVRGHLEQTDEQLRESSEAHSKSLEKYECLLGQKTGSYAKMEGELGLLRRTYEALSKQHRELVALQQNTPRVAGA